MSNNIFGGYHLPSNIGQTTPTDLSNYVTLDGAQEITGAKNLSNPDNTINCQSINTSFVTSDITTASSVECDVLTATGIITGSEGHFPQGVQVGDLSTNNIGGSLSIDNSSNLTLSNDSPFSSFSATAQIMTATHMGITDGSDRTYYPGMIAFTGIITTYITAYSSFTKANGACTVGNSLIYFAAGAGGLSQYDFLIGSAASTLFPLGTYILNLIDGFSIQMSRPANASGTINYKFGRMPITSSTITASTAFTFQTQPYPYVKIKNSGTDVITITPNIGTTINGATTINGLAKYPDIGTFNTRQFPSSPSINSNGTSFEFNFIHITGSNANESGTITLFNNVFATTNYSVMSSFYYGYSGSGGTYDALNTSQALYQMVISNITATSFTYNFRKGTGNNVNIYVQFLVVYNALNTDFAKSY